MMLHPTPTQHYLVSIRLQRKISFVNKLRLLHFLSDLKNTIFSKSVLEILNSFITALLQAIASMNYDYIFKTYSHFSNIFVVILSWYNVHCTVGKLLYVFTTYIIPKFPKYSNRFRR